MMRVACSLALVLALIAPASAAAQPAPAPSGKSVRLGLLSTDSAFADFSPMLEAFRQGLAERGWVEGQNVELIRRYARSDRAYFLGNAVLALGAELIVAATTAGALAARDSTTTVPVVFVGVSDPMGSGVVSSLGPRRGGNVAGFTDFDVASTARGLALLKQAAPAVTRVSVLVNSEAPRASRSVAEVEITAKSLGLTVHQRVAKRPEEIPAALARVVADYDQALVVMPDPLFNAFRKPIIDFAAEHRLPAVYGYRGFATEGGFMTYGTDMPDLYRRAAEMVDRILRGAVPGDLAVEGPTKFHLAINLKTAQRLRITIPESLRGQADQLIE
jgi:putative ABC transport system substrate-binding protein